MKRPGFTVETTGGINYDANHLMICVHDGEWVVTLICSGGLTMVPADRIKEIRFSKEGPTYCNECDNPLMERMK